MYNVDCENKCSARQDIVTDVPEKSKTVGGFFKLPGLVYSNWNDL